MENLERKPNPKANTLLRGVTGREIIEDREKSLVIRKSIERAFSFLKEKRTTILKMRLGIKPYERKYTLQEIAEVLKVSDDAILAHQHKALRIVYVFLYEDLKKAGYDEVNNDDLYFVSYGKDGLNNLKELIEKKCPELL